MKILVTGAGGELGQVIQRELQNDDVIALKRVDLDITNLQDVRSSVHKHKPDIVINAAAYDYVDKAETDSERAFLVNETGPKNLAIACEENKTGLVHVSTDYVFNGKSIRPYNENDEPSPISIYGASKLAGENAVAQHCQRHFITRTAWLYDTIGPNFPLRMMSMEAAKVRVVKDQIGSPTLASHLVAAIKKLVRTQDYGLYHLAGGGETSWFDLTREIFRLCQINKEIEPIPMSEYRYLAPRPVYAPLVSVRGSLAQLPHWKEGAAEFAKRLNKKITNDD